LGQSSTPSSVSAPGQAQMSETSSEVQRGYIELEALTLELLCKLIREGLSSEDSPSASLLGTAVSMLKAGRIQETSTKSLTEAQAKSSSWFHDLPESAKQSLRESAAGDRIQAIEDAGQ